jgi:hypothetical protein
MATKNSFGMGEQGRQGGVSLVTTYRRALACTLFSLAGNGTRHFGISTTRATTAGHALKRTAAPLQTLGAQRADLQTSSAGHRKNLAALESTQLAYRSPSCPRCLWNCLCLRLYRLKTP